MIIKRLFIYCLTVLLVACKADGLVEDQSVESQSTPTGVAAPLSNSEFQSLKPEKQYQVANKLAATLYKGVPVDEFFDFNTYGDSLKVSDDGNAYLSETREALQIRLKNRDKFVNLIDARHNLGNDDQRVMGEPLASVMEYEISRDQFEVWMAYILANTILFSPAEEIASADSIDVQRIYDGLVRAMGEDVSIRNIILTHMKSQANWRRFRSPEDNTREMIEIYLGLFDRDADVPKASIACKNWSLTGENAGYELLIDESERNVEPQKVLGSWVTTCEDFYEVVANHPLVIPRITTYLVDWFFPTSSAQKRGAIVADIVAKNPVRFHDIFTAIIFSKEYLINNEKPKSFEESFLNLAERIEWRPTDRFIRELTGNSATEPNLKNMKQPTMSLKLGRFKDQPMDSLSFAYYHKAVRERVLAKVDNRWGSWGNEFIRKGDFFEQEDFIDFLFLSIMSRKATQEEIDTLKEVFLDTGNETSRENQTRITFDYISRLPDLYFYKTITTGDAQ